VFSVGVAETTTRPARRQGDRGPNNAGTDTRAAVRGAHVESRQALAVLHGDADERVPVEHPEERRAAVVRRAMLRRVLLDRPWMPARHLEVVVDENECPVA